MESGFLVLFYLLKLLFHSIFFLVVLGTAWWRGQYNVDSAMLSSHHVRIPSSNINKWYLLQCPTFTPSILSLDSSRINVLWADILNSNFLFSARQAYYKPSFKTSFTHSSHHCYPSKVSSTFVEVTYWV